MARADDQQRDAIVLDDGTWVDVGQDGRWRPTPGERVRAGVILGVSLGVLLLLALVLSFGDGTREGDVRAAATTTTSITPGDETTTAPDTQQDPSSVGDEPASPECVSDDREGQSLRDRRTAVALVRNGTSRAGHAGEVSERLRDLGYDVTVPANADRREVTSIGYLAGYCAEAERAAQDLGLPDATVEPVPPELLGQVDRARIVVSLGADSL